MNDLDALKAEFLRHLNETKGIEAFDLTERRVECHVNGELVGHAWYEHAPPTEFWAGKFVGFFKPLEDERVEWRPARKPPSPEEVEAEVLERAERERARLEAERRRQEQLESIFFARDAAKLIPSIHFFTSKQLFAMEAKVRATPPKRRKLAHRRLQEFLLCTKAHVAEVQRLMAPLDELPYDYRPIAEAILAHDRAGRAKYVKL